MMVFFKYHEEELAGEEGNYIHDVEGSTLNPMQVLADIA